MDRKISFFSYEQCYESYVHMDDEGTGTNDTWMMDEGRWKIQDVKK